MTSALASAINRPVICPGNSRMTATASRETIPLAIKQHFSMARTREIFPAPQLYPTAGWRESHIP